MKTKWLTILAGAVTAVVVVSIAMGLATPDGSVGDTPSASSSPTTTTAPTATSTPTPTPAPTPTVSPADADLAPESVSGVWPGRPAATTLDGDQVNWCPAVRIKSQAEAVSIFGAKAVDAAACAAVSFVFEKRYSRLSIPRQSYKSSAFDFVLKSLSPSTAQVYRSRIGAFVANPGSVSARDALGLVLLRGAGKVDGHTSAGVGRVYYGKAYTTAGYRDRATWINPKWSTVTISVDRSMSRPRVKARFTANASVPVFCPDAKRADMLTVATTATYLLQHDGGTAWSISSWTVTTNTLGFAPLSVK